MKHIFLATVVLANFSSIGISAEEPKLVRVPVTAAFVPQGFDSNDRAQLVIEGYFPNTCYRIGPTQVKVNSKDGAVQIEQWAYLHKGMCAQMIVPYDQEVSIGHLKDGNYDVRDGAYGEPLARLPIHLATQSEPDEFLYAPVRDAYALPEGRGPRMARIEGSFPSTCYQMKEVKIVQESERVIALLPIMEKVPNSPCLRRYHPFTEDVALPHLAPGRHLLHVRSLNGEAVNKLFDIFPGNDRRK